MCWSVFLQLLLPSLLLPPPLFHPPPSSSHGVIQWKISAVNLSAYRSSVVTTPWTLPCCCLAVWGGRCPTAADVDSLADCLTWLYKMLRLLIVLSAWLKISQCPPVDPADFSSSATRRFWVKCLNNYCNFNFVDLLTFHLLPSSGRNSNLSTLVVYWGL